MNNNNKSHSRHFSASDCDKMGLKIIALEDDQDLQELVLSVHHATIITIDGTMVSNQSARVQSSSRDP